MDPVLAGGLVEMARLGLLMYMQSVALAGMTEAEKKLLWEKTEEEFYSKLDEPLPEVPE